MTIQTNVVRRPGSSRFYARIAVPGDLREIMGRRELWKSLRTADPREARARAAPVLAAWQREFDELRRKRRPSGADLEAAVWRHYVEELEHDRLDRAQAPKAADLDTLKAEIIANHADAASLDDPAVLFGDDKRPGIIDFQAAASHPDTARANRTTREAALRDHLARGEVGAIEWAADEVIRRDGLMIEKGTPAYFDLAQRLQRAELEALKRSHERDAGDWTGKPTDELVAPPSPDTLLEIAAPGETIMELYDTFKREKRGSITADTWDQNRKIVQRFAEFIGETSPVSGITRKAVRDWKQQLALWPTKANDIAAFKELTFREIIERNAKLGKPPISGRTINKYLSALGAFCGWLLANDYITADVMRGQYLEIDKSEKKVLPFTNDQLTAVFGCTLYTGFERDGREHRPGSQHCGDWRFWLPLIALHTGARLGEIVQMQVEDVRQLHGTWIFHITTEGNGDKSTKTGGSMRVVPVHPKLIEIGFLDYRAAMHERGETALFPEIKRDARGQISGEASKFFNALFRRIGVKTDKSVNFHSFRHTVADALRRAGYLDEQFAPLLGHTKASTTGRYGILPQGTLENRHKMIMEIRYSDLDLSKIHRNPCSD